MRASMFNVRVPLDGRTDVFLMNTFTDAQIVVSEDVLKLLDRLSAESPINTASAEAPLTPEDRDTLATLAEHGFVVESRAKEREALDRYYDDFREDTSELRVTVLTTLQCNFACDYCFQGDHGDYNKFAAKMSPETAARTADWIAERLDALHPKKFVLNFFGGEPLLNLPVVYQLAERAFRDARSRGVDLDLGIITNGLLLTPEVVDRLVPYGLGYVKITLDGDQQTHDRMRPLRGGQGTFDRIIDNVRRVADKVRVVIGGNFDASTVDSYPALLDFLKEQEFADKLAKVAFKPIIRNATPAPSSGVIPLTPVGADGRPGPAGHPGLPDDKPLGGSCMTAAGAGGSICDTCHLVDEQIEFVREETEKRGFPTSDGVHMGPCEIHMRHAHTIGPDGELYACPGFSGERQESVGTIGGVSAPRHDAVLQAAARERFEHLAAWKECGDCAFIPVCAGGCSAASHSELGDMNTPSCHKSMFESAVTSLAHKAAGISMERTR